jgi:hypothetical protein
VLRRRRATKGPKGGHSGLTNEHSVLILEAGPSNLKITGINMRTSKYDLAKNCWEVLAVAESNL